MTAYLIRRTLFAAFVLWGAVTIVFLVLRMVPGDPALLILGSDATPDEIEQLREQMGLNQPLLVQYGIYLADVVRFDFGDSYRYHADAMGLVLDRFPLTLQLAVVAMVIGLVLGIALGVVGALRVNRLADRIVSVFALLAQSMPSFWIGIMFILVFARQLHIFASGGHGGFDRLIMPGRVPHEEVERYYSLIDIAPFPRKPWPVCEMVSPMKPLEALAMEKAVVASDVRALAEMIQDQRTGLLFRKGDVSSLADVLARLMADPELRRNLGREGRAWVAAQRTWRAVGANAATIMDGVLRRHG